MKNRTEFAILGLVAYGPKSGYDIRKQVQETLSHFWNESVSHIYPMLRRLHGKGLVTRTTESSDGRPPRHVYSITEDGLAELRQWLTEPVEPAPPRLEILLKVFFGAHSHPRILVDHIERYRAARARVLATLEGIEAVIATEGNASRDITYSRLTLASGIYAARAAIAWCDDALAELRRLDDSAASYAAPTLPDRSD